MIFEIISLSKINMNEMNKLFYIEIEPKYMTSSIHETILKKIQNKYVNTCSEKNGYVLDITEYNRILFSGINDCNGNLFFKVECKTNMLLPTIGKKIDCNVDMIFQHGIFAGFKNLKVLVPAGTLSRWKYDTDKFKKGKQTISVGDNISVEITEIRYENCKYSCIGKLC